MSRPARGFTLIELMVVVAIVSIIMMLAIAAYRDYTIRSMVAEGLVAVGPARTGVSETGLSGDWPSNNSAAGIGTSASFSTKYVQSIAVTAAGHILVALDIPELGTNNIIRFVPTRVGGMVIWNCTQGSVRATYRPSACRP
ncbi:Pilin-like competence factor ComP [Gammaproteobacteria bacterium]